MANRLKYEKSPYLLQHKDNPVEWYPWGEEAFSRAKEENKPVFLSIGYSTCHWCHVMAEESFEDKEVAEVLNAGFISIKVDREERPDIDSVYMSVCQTLNGSGGWPLTILMDAEKKPFFAGTYLPKHTRAGHWGLIELLIEVRRLWSEERAHVDRLSKQITDFLKHRQESEEGNPEKHLLRLAYSQFAATFDTRYGGFGRAPKFPTPHNLMFLCDYAKRERENAGEYMSELTLDAMEKGGIHDAIGGGFSRYSTDDMWLVPHFEKMLYDNALLMIAYTRMYQKNKRESFRRVIVRTAEYVLRELQDPLGGFYCGQDADSEGVEGKYYVFTPKEVMQILGERDGKEFCRRYDITEKGNFEGKSIPNRIQTEQEAWTPEDLRLQKLYDYRKERTCLHRDDKCLLSWNAWMMIALAYAGTVLDDGKYLRAALLCQQFIEEYMTDAENRLYLRYREGERANQGQLDDYAVYTLALITLYRTTFRAEYLEGAITYAEQMLALFEDKETGGFFMNASDGEELFVRPKESYDGAIPSGNSVAAMVLEELAQLTGMRKFREAADRQHRYIAGQAKETPMGHAFGLLAMAKMLYPHRELLCVGETVPTEVMKFLKKHAPDSWNLLFISAENRTLLAKCAPFTADYPLPDTGTTMWYLCENGACKTPTDKFSDLEL